LILKANSLRSVQANIEATKAIISQEEAEITKPLTSSLTLIEENRLKELRSSLQALQTSLSDVLDAKIKVNLYRIYQH
jgi:hypothetical protein